jgi:hypothetical protein
MNVLEELLSDGDFAESISVIPKGSTASTASTALTARVRRESSETLSTDEKRSGVYRYTICCMATVHAVFGGLVSPQIGDNWTLARVQGATAEAGWIAGAPVGHGGFWQIPVALTDVDEIGKTRRQPQ